MYINWAALHKYHSRAKKGDTYKLNKWKLSCSTTSSLLFNEHNFPGVTILLSLTIFLNMVSAMMPVTDNNPLLGNSEILLRRKSINVTLKKAKTLSKYEKIFSNSTATSWKSIIALIIFSYDFKIFLSPVEPFTVFGRLICTFSLSIINIFLAR